MLSLLSKIWLKYKNTIITSLKLHQISTNQSITYQNYIWTKHIIFQKKKLSQKYQQQLQQKLQTALTEAEIASAEATVVAAHSAVASAMVPEIEGSHKDHLTIFIQTMNLMPNIFPSSKRSHFKWHHLTANSCNSCDSTIKSLTLLLLAKKQNPTNETTYFVKDFFLFTKFPFNQF